MNGRPVVTCLLTTRDRPDFLSIALAAYEAQREPDRELIVIDDGDRFPADESPIVNAGGRLVRVAPGTPLGEKLNAGASLATGHFLHKMDDDDWYGAHFLETMRRRIEMEWEVTCTPALAYVQPVHFFSIARWEIRRSRSSEVGGGSLFFPRYVWESVPFRQIGSQVDFWFVFDARRAGVRGLSVDDNRAFLNVRHSSVGAHHPHIWQVQGTGQQVDEAILAMPHAGIEPEQAIPEWAIARYRAMHDAWPGETGGLSTG
jgi:glycosyltransferase involved in cell wall biosynthesis